MNITFGTDPEFALVNKQNRIVSAIPVLGRGKEDKIDLGNGAKIYFDNTLVEANIDPAESREDLVCKLKDLYELSRQILKDHGLGAVASHNFSDEECEHPEAKEFGCNPEKDVYCGGEDCYPPEGGHSFRSAGGHIHIGGIGDKTDREKAHLVILMDIFVGLPSVLLDNDPTSVARKELYGKAGRYRETDYGIEYRVLSNYWLSNKDLTEVIYDLSLHASKIFLSEGFEETLDSINLSSISQTINSGDKKKAKEIFDTLNIPLDIKERVNFLSKQKYNSNIFENWLD